MRKISEIFVAGIVCLFALFVLVIGGWLLVNLTFTLNQISPVMGIPIGYVYLVLPLTGILFMYYSTCFIVEALKRNRSTE